MNAEIVSIGTELLLGEITDTNATWIARQLRDVGINLFYVTAVGDNEGRITQTLKQALDRSDLVITSGGLGPTVDDMTRQAVAAATGRPLLFQQHLLDQIAARFEQFGVTMTENNRQQAYIPEGAIIVENAVGTAPCFIVEIGGKIILSLPGVPREMKYLMQTHILPYLAQKMGLPAIIKARVLHTAGIGESYVDEAVKDYMTLSNPTVGLAAHSGRTDVRITVRADSMAEADTMLDEMDAKLRERIGKYIYGVDADNNLEAVLAGYLLQQGIQFNLCEAGTNRAVSNALTALRDATVTHTLESYQSVDDLILEMGLEAGMPLKEVAAAALEHLLLKQPQGVGMVVLQNAEGEAGLGIKTPQKVHLRDIRLGGNADGEAVKWATQWGLGYLWRYLREVG